MALQHSVAVRNAQLDAIETAIGASAILEMRTGAPPANCAAASTGTKLVSMALPADWLDAAASGAKAKSGTWSDPVADATGTIGHFRIFDSTGATCHQQGTVTITGGGGDMTVDDLDVVASQTVLVTAYTLTAGNA